MNVGFFGIQYSFGLQQGNMSPIYRYLGADEASLPLLWLAGPDDGALVQPIVGAMSDRTLSPRGRRTPYFLVGAVLCSVALLLMPFSPALWAAAGLLWILDAGNNVTMEPYRAFVSDRLDASQHSIGFLTQSAFTGLGQTLSYLTPSLLVLLGMNRDRLNAHGIPHDHAVGAFVIGAVFSITSILVDGAHHARAAARAGGARAHRGACRAASGRRCARWRGDPRHAVDDEAARRHEALPVVRDVLLLAVHRALAGGDAVRHLDAGVAPASARPTS
jgi:MFS family permease